MVSLAINGLLKFNGKHQRLNVCRRRIVTIQIHQEEAALIHQWLLVKRGDVFLQVSSAVLASSSAIKRLLVRRKQEVCTYTASIHSWNRNQRLWRTASTVGYVQLCATNIILSAAKVIGIVKSYVFDA